MNLVIMHYETDVSPEPFDIENIKDVTIISLEFYPHAKVITYVNQYAGQLTRYEFNHPVYIQCVEVRK